MHVLLIMMNYPVLNYPFVWLPKRVVTEPSRYLNVLLSVCPFTGWTITEVLFTQSTITLRSVTVLSITQISGHRFHLNEPVLEFF